ncbi:hypothetical protein RhiLY_07997 [Ceratobasidium sp. AG-Ba]|nr:hypothetical protein RhiLY_07997 [Ceratobasidium sp. AG-Ba]
MPPLPGLVEIEEATQGYNDEERRWLSDRIERLLSVARSFDESQSTEFSLTAKSLYEIHEAFEKESRATWKSGMLNAERRQRMIRDLNHRIDNVVEASLIGTVHKSLQTRNMDNFTTISSHEINDQTVLYTANGGRPIDDRLQFSCSQDEDSVVVCTRRGQYRNVQVIYKTYTSRSAAGAATQAAERDLKLLSSFLHPNIAPIVGITRGYHGLNGYAVLGGIPLNDYWPMVKDGATIAKILRGIVSLRSSGSLTDDMGVHFTVDARGNAVGILTRSAPNPTPLYSYFLDYLSVPCIYPAASLVLKICGESNSMQSRLIDALECLDPSGFSELGVARVAAKLRLVSRVAMLMWEGHAPIGVVKCGDVGYITGANTENLGWDAIVTNQAVDTYYHSTCNHSDPCVTDDFFSALNFRDEEWKKTPYGGWIRVEINNALLSCICWTSPVRDWGSHAAGERARDALIEHATATIYHAL